ncbi:MAG: hypothetical protein EAZ57_07530 [Cytophagales bacterium]|nr:MAG: hypothetical protein EAZ67_08615 [Cytophagales bacterium]TAF60389.1 MAG: hypothetical protein EAZ57_07530 [Cytophagales bacterium]
MQPDDIIVSYKGAPSSGFLDDLLSVADDKLSVLESQSKLRKKVYHILVEVLQNIHHHYDNTLAQSEAPIICVLTRHTDGTYYIHTGNFVRSEDVSTLKSQIDTVNSLNPEQIKDLYRKTLDNGEMSAKGGAGLGIIDIARRSGQPLDYEFQDYDNGSSFFNLKVKISA